MGAAVNVSTSLLEFPCEYTIKVLGRADSGLDELVVDVVARHCSDGCSAADVRDSRHGRFVSVNVTFTATSLDQLQGIHSELNASDRVSLIL